MKTLFRMIFAGSILLTINLSRTLAQNESTMAEQIERLFSQLDFTEVSSNVLYDYGMDFFNWRLMHGKHHNDSIIVNAEQWGYLCFQATSSGVNDYDPLPDAAPYLTWANKLPSDPDTVAIGVLLLDYHYILDDAITEGFLTWNATDTLLEDVFPRPESPYMRDTMIAVAALRTMYHTQDIHFLISDSLFFGNMPFPDSIWIDCGDGHGWRGITLNTPLPVSYADTGDFVVIVRLFMQGDDERYGRTNIRIEEDFQQLGWEKDSRYNLEPDDNVMFIPGCTMNIFYANPCGQIRKPFIFIEAWNPNLPGLKNRDFNEMIDRMHRPNDIKLPNDNTLWEQLDAEGYDLVFVDFDDGGGDLYANAEVVRGVIEWVNAQKAAVGSRHQNLIVGASMGGVCGFMALKEMEMEAVDTETELFITYDSPLRGANVPIGLQAMVGILGNTESPGGKKLKELDPRLALFEAMLNLPSSKQMKYLDYFNENGKTIGHDDFYNDIHSNGPLVTPHVAISNGSGIGESQNLFPGQLFLKIKEDWNLGNKSPFILGGFKLDYAEVYLLNDPESEWTTVYKQKYQKFLSILGIGGYYMSSTQGYTVDDSPYMYDHAPGGNQNFGLDKAFKDAEYLANSGVWCFVPTVSALNIPDNPDPSQSIGSECGGGAILRCLFSADASVANPLTGSADHNQEHVSVNRKQTEFLANLSSRGQSLEDASPLSSRIYNFGSAHLVDIPFEGNEIIPRSTPTVIEESIEIVEGGELWINRDDRISFIDVSANLSNDPEQSFEVNIVPDCEENETIVTIADGGVIRIGDESVGSTGKLISNLLTSIIVEESGEIILEEGYHNNLVLQGGHMIIEDDGLVHARWGSRIVINNGSTLTVKTGGILRISHYSTLEVEEGGTLVIEPGAIIQLWDGQEPGGEATIRIKDGGTLEWQGSPDFSGNGFFQFDADHVFVATDDVHLVGMGKDFRFIRLNGNAHLQIEGVSVTLELGAVEYLDDSEMYIIGGHCTMEDVLCYGASTAIAVNMAAPESVLITGSTFEDLGGVYVDGYTGIINNFLIEDCAFDDCDLGLGASNCKFITVKSSNFHDCTPAIFLEEEVNYFYGFDLDIQTINLAEPKDEGIILFDATIFRLHSSTVAGFKKGIHLIEPNTDFNRSNVFLYNTLLQDCEDAIYLSDGGVGPDRGLVWLDCTRAIDNNYVVRGEDVLLAVDALSHATTHPIQGVTPNEFSLKELYTSEFFKVCYKERNDVNEILARENLWDGSGTNGDPYPYYDFTLKKAGSLSGNCNASSANVDVIFTPIATSGAFTCPDPPRSPEGPGIAGSGDYEESPDTSLHCLWITTSTPADTLAVHDNYIRGMHWFYWEDFDQSYDELEPIAAIPDTVRSGLSGRCRQYIDVSRVMVDVLDSLVSDRSLFADSPGSHGVTSVHETPNAGALTIYPNPAMGLVNIRPGNETACLRITNAWGQQMKEIQGVSSELTISLEGWPEGIYIIMGIAKTGQITSVNKLLVSH